MLSIKNKLSLLFALILQLAVSAQKKSIDAFTDIENWPKLADAFITNDGNYFAYFRQQGSSELKTLIIGSTKNNWRKTVSNAKKVLFTRDSRTAFVLNQNDSLLKMALGTNEVKLLAKANFFIAFLKDSCQWLAFQSDENLTLINLVAPVSKQFRNVTNFWLSGDDGRLLLATKPVTDGNLVRVSYFKDFTSAKGNIIWEGSNVFNVVFDNSAKRVVFCTGDKSHRELFYFKDGMDKAISLIKSGGNDVPDGLRFESVSFFCNVDNALVISLRETDFPPQVNGVDVWSYCDSKLQSQQLKELIPPGTLINPGGPQSFYAKIDLGNLKITQLGFRNEEVRFLKFQDLAVITSWEGGEKTEWNWNKKALPKFYLLNIRTGNRKLLRLNYPYSISPGGSYLVGTDSPIPGVSNNLISYRIKDGKMFNLTKFLPIPIDESEVFGAYSLRHRALKIAAWKTDENSVFVYDKFDIWKIDLEGKRQKNITSSYGRKKHLVFRFSFYPNIPNITSESIFYLSAFNVKDKENGFFCLKSGGNTYPTRLFMGPYVFHACTTSDFNYIKPPIKALQADLYIVERQSASESPNYFLTNNFKNFKPISDIHPERNYNWLTSKLISFQCVNRNHIQAVLYLPEDFNPKKKYPVIIHYYEKKSDRLNEYVFPDLINDNINIPWLVSNGYVVVTPDIDYKIGKVGACVLSSVLGAAKYLTTFSWVDSKRIGIQGHSFAGYETNYIVTHTDFFAAAESGSGESDMISAYSSTMLSTGVPDSRNSAEVGQERMGATLWERPDFYICNSPLFSAHKVKTPILLMNNQHDAIVSFSQGVEFFTALRRMGKRAWMLQYDDELHSLREQKNKIDYTLRMIQFFNHYLKDSACPRWMMYGIPAKDKGIDNGYELVKERDSKTGKWLTPKEGGLLTDEEKKKVEALKHRKPVTVTIE